MIRDLKYVYNGIRYDKQKFVLHLSLKIDIVKAFIIILIWAYIF